MQLITFTITNLIHELTGQINTKIAEEQKDNWITFMSLFFLLEL